jgi:upstream activation factor subunit UAF30
MTSAKNDMTSNESSLQEDELFVEFSTLITQLNKIKNQVTDVQHTIRELERRVKKNVKVLKKEIETKVKIKQERKPSGFAKPSKVTNELCHFMNKSEGTEIARTDVTKALVAYIKENKLENTKNSKIIAPDETLKVLLGVEDGEELNYFNIQKYMNKHFVKTTNWVIEENKL